MRPLHGFFGGYASYSPRRAEQELAVAARSPSCATRAASRCWSSRCRCRRGRRRSLALDDRGGATYGDRERDPGLDAVVARSPRRVRRGGAGALAAVCARRTARRASCSRRPASSFPRGGLAATTRRPGRSPPARRAGGAEGRLARPAAQDRCRRRMLGVDPADAARRGGDVRRGSGAARRRVRGAHGGVRRRRPGGRRAARSDVRPGRADRRRRDLRRDARRRRSSTLAPARSGARRGAAAHAARVAPPGGRARRPAGRRRRCRPGCLRDRRRARGRPTWTRSRSIRCARRPTA